MLSKISSLSFFLLMVLGFPLHQETFVLLSANFILTWSVTKKEKEKKKKKKKKLFRLAESSLGTRWRGGGGRGVQARMKACLSSNASRASECGCPHLASLLIVQEGKPHPRGCWFGPDYDQALKSLCFFITQIGCLGFRAWAGISVLTPF